MTPDQQFLIDERAAIIEFDGGLNRVQAEGLAQEAYRVERERIASTPLFSVFSE